MSTEQDVESTDQLNVTLGEKKNSHKTTAQVICGPPLSVYTQEHRGTANHNKSNDAELSS